MPSTCPHHLSAVVVHDGETCPICEDLGALRFDRARLARLVDAITGHVGSLAQLLVLPEAPPVEGTAPVPTPTTEPTPDADEDLPDEKTARGLVHVLEAESYHQCHAAIRNVATLNGIRAAKNSYREATGNRAERAWTADDLADAWALLRFPAGAPAEVEAVEDPILATRAAAEEFLAGWSEVAQVSDTDADDEREPTERESWIAARIFELRQDSALSTWGALAKAYRSLFGAEPAITLDAVALREAIAEREWADAHPGDDDDNDQSIPF